MFPVCALPGQTSDGFTKRLTKLGIKDFSFSGYPVRFFDVFGKKGHPVRATISEMGPDLMSRLLELNDTQSGVMQIIFKIADDQGYSCWI
jgi:DNA helicase HerA-like ATPase